MKLTIWTNNGFSVTENKEHSKFKSALAQHTLLEFPESADGLQGEARAALETADVAFGYPNAEAVVACERIRWIQLNSAGYTTYDRDDVKGALKKHKTVLTNSSFVYDEPCAQHVLAMILAIARQLPAALDAQRGDRDWPMARLRSSSRLLNGQKIILLGFGAIARRVAELLQPLGMDLMAVRRRVDGTEPIRVEEVSCLDEFLPFADHLVNILPSNNTTKHFLNQSRLSKLKRGAIVYNIGRGATLDQDALASALKDGRVSAAYLDVTDPEPLPPDHPLWTIPNCFITPHSAGGHANEKERQVNHFLENLRRFERDEPLLNRVW